MGQTIDKCWKVRQTVVMAKFPAVDTPEGWVKAATNTVLVESELVPVYRATPISGVKELRNNQGSYQGKIRPLAYSQDMVEAMIAKGLLEFYSLVEVPALTHIPCPAHDLQVRWEAWMDSPESQEAIKAEFRNHLGTMGHHILVDGELRTV